MAVHHVPQGYHTVTPYLIIDGAAKAIDFYTKAFGAVEQFRMEKPGGVAHAEIKIGDSHIMLADEMPEMGYRGPKSYGGTPVSLMIYVEDCDKVFQQAINAGATVKQEIQDQFYGDRSGQVTDPFGHQWTIATHVEDVPPDEINRRAEQWMKQTAGA